MLCIHTPAAPHPALSPPCSAVPFRGRLGSEGLTSPEVCALVIPGRAGWFCLPFRTHSLGHTSQWVQCQRWWQVAPTPCLPRSPPPTPFTQDQQTKGGLGVVQG